MGATRPCWASSCLWGHRNIEFSLEIIVADLALEAEHDIVHLMIVAGHDVAEPAFATDAVEVEATRTPQEYRFR